MIDCDTMQRLESVNWIVNTAKCAPEKEAQKMVKLVIFLQAVDFTPIRNLRHVNLEVRQTSIKTIVVLIFTP